MQYRNIIIVSMHTRKKITSVHCTADCLSDWRDKVATGKVWRVIDLMYSQFVAIVFLG